MLHFAYGWDYRDIFIDAIFYHPIIPAKSQWTCNVLNVELSTHIFNQYTVLGMALLPLIKVFALLCDEGALKQPSLPHIILRIYFHSYQTIVQLFHHFPLLLLTRMSTSDHCICCKEAFQEACHPPFSECSLCDTLHGA